MILRIVDRFTGESEDFVIHSNEDFHPLVMTYPELRGVIFNAPTVEARIEAIAAEMGKRHNLKVETIGENIFETGRAFSKAVQTLGLTAMLASCTPIAKSDYDIQKYRPYGYRPEDGFLQAIMELESSSGKNLNHTDPDTIGRFGLRVPTIQDIIRRFDPNNADLRPLMTMPADDIKALFKKRPELELHLARLLSRYLISKTNKNLYKAAFSWRWGHNINPDHITEQKLADEPYVKRFHSLAKDGKLSKAEHPFQSRFEMWLKKRKRIQEQNIVPTEPDYSLPRDETNPETKYEDTWQGKLTEAIDHMEART